MTESKKIKILGSEYLIKFPNFGEYNAIESLKSTHTYGEYGAMAKNAVGVTSQERNLDFIDAFTTFSILAKDFNNNTGFKKLSDVDMKSGLLMTKAYMKHYKPWVDAIMEELNDIEDDFDAIAELEKEAKDNKASTTEE